MTEKPFDPHSMLCVPADSKRFFAKAATRGADLIVLDLEDGVAPAAKHAARLALAAAIRLLNDQAMPVYVRINNDQALLHDDVAAAVAAGADGVVLPKAESMSQLAQLDALLSRHELELRRAEGNVRIIALIETPIGVCRAFEIAQASARLVSMGLGPEDFATAMYIAPALQALSGPAQAVAIAAVAAGLHPIGLPGPVGDFTDLSAYRETVRCASMLGMRGAICIHPAQVQILNEGFGGSAAEIEEARTVIIAFDAALSEGRGSVALNGRMIDAPIANRARQLLASQQLYPRARNVPLRDLPTYEACRDPAP